MPFRFRNFLLLGLLMTVGASAALAFEAVPGSDPFAIPRPGWVEDEGQWIEKLDLQPAMMKASPIASFEQRNGGNWHYRVNKLTGSLHTVYGSGIDFSGPLGNKADSESAARSFIDANQELFSTGTSSLRTVEVANGAGKWATHFDQVVHGLRVHGGRANTVFTESGRVFVTGADIFPDVDVNPTPSLSRQGALAIAKNDIGFLDGRDKLRDEELMILPVRSTQGEIATLEYKLAWRFDLDLVDPLGYFVTHVDANTGEILWRENRIHTVLSGSAEGDVEWESECDGFTNNDPMRDMDVVISGVGTATTDANGDFSIAGTGTYSWSAGFTGTWLDIDRYTGTNGQLSGSISDGSPITVDWNTGNSLPAEMDIWAYINRQHQWIKDLDPAWTGMDFQSPCVVERTDGYCPGNAWYSPGDQSINFCKEGSGYGNTGRLGDVAYHEWGHSLTYEVYASQPRTSLHEGNSDIAAILLSRESIIGLGFFTGNCVSGIRNADNTMQYPADWSNSHTGGQIIAGFFWDSWQELLATLPQAQADQAAAYGWHFGRRLGLPQLEEDQVLYTFIADDDDGNLDNGTPNYSAFCVGATNHGFSCPPILSDVSISHTPVTSHTNAALPIDVTATITSSGAAINVGACAVHYSVDGGAFSSVGMSPAGSDDYTGQIPAQAAGATVDYYIYGEDNNGDNATHPSLAPTNVHSFIVGDFQTVFFDDFETDQGWTIGTPNDATTGNWERGDPQGTTNGGQVQPEDDNTPGAGVNCWATQLASGSSAGSYDIDGGTTTLMSPVFDLSDKAIAIVSYYRWYSNNLGGGPGEDSWVVSVNDGSGWVDLENTTASANSWNQHTFNLGSSISLTSTVQFRFRASDLNTPSLVEAALDDFELLAIDDEQVPDYNLSSISSNTDLMACPAGDGDEGLTATVTVLDTQGTPIVGIPAGDIVLFTSGASSNGTDMSFCSGTPNFATWPSTSATDVNGEVTYQIDKIGGCGVIAISATVFGSPILSGANATVVSPDMNGDGVVDFFDSFEFIPELMAGTGTCANLDRSGDGVVNFFDTNKLLPHYIPRHTCP